MYEIYYKESTGLFKNETVNSMEDHIKLQKLMSDTLYLIKIRAGRQVDGTQRWSNYRRISARTHQAGINYSRFRKVPFTAAFLLQFQLRFLLRIFIR